MFVSTSLIVPELKPRRRRGRHDGRPFAVATFRPARSGKAVKAASAFQRAPEGLGLYWLAALVLRVFCCYPLEIARSH